MICGEMPGIWKSCDWLYVAPEPPIDMQGFIDVGLTVILVVIAVLLGWGVSHLTSD